MADHLQQCASGLEIQHKLTPENRARVEDMLEAYGLAPSGMPVPQNFPGGMRQRAALIRTLALDPALLLLDEPFSALDYQTRLHVADDIGQIIRRERKTALLVTHDISEAISMADRVIILSPPPRQSPPHCTRFLKHSGTDAHALPGGTGIQNVF